MCPNSKVILNEYGKIVENELLKTKEIRKNIQINHYIITTNNKGHMQCVPTKKWLIKKNPQNFGGIFLLIFLIFQATRRVF